jgi:hypothetical protein
LALAAIESADGGIEELVESRPSRASNSAIREWARSSSEANPTTSPASSSYEGDGGSGVDTTQMIDDQHPRSSPTRRHRSPPSHTDQLTATVQINRTREWTPLRVLMSTRVINHLKDLIVSASEDLRAQLRHMTSDAQISYCAALRTRPTRDLAHRTTTRELQCTAQRVLALCTEANELQAEQRINPACPTLSLQLQRFRPQDRGSANARPYTSTPAARSPPESSVHCPRRDVCEVRLPVPGWLRFNPFTS